MKNINAKLNEGKDIDMVLELNMEISALTQFGVTNCIEEIEEISDVASKEWNNECLIKTMKEEWVPLNFDTKEHKDTFILDGEATEIIQTVLDDHLIKTQTMKGSPYAQPFIDEILEWETTLDNTQSFLDVWIKV
jgi:dynein heavy chain, axonemal